MADGQESTEPRQLRLAVNGIEMCLFEWGDAGGQQVLFVHATGFHARCWDRVIAALPAAWHVYALDMRGHGRSGKQGPFDWRQFGDDLLEVANQLGLRDAIGVGHSMGGHCVAHVCAESPATFASLLLVDPVILAPESYQEKSRFSFGSVESHPVARRRSHFSSWRDMHERYRDRSPYSLWQPEVFVDYCRYGVVPSKTGKGVDLACPGRIEASIYTGNSGSDLHVRIPSIRQPVTILRAPPRTLETPEMDFTASPTWPGLADQFPNGTDVYLPDLTHFIPMQDPALVARYVVDATP